jgi:hypothetical protein
MQTPSYSTNNPATKFSATSRFFLFCSGSDTNWLSHCSQREINKHFGIGSLVFMTAVFAFFSSAYAFHSLIGIDENGKQDPTIISVTVSLFFACLWSILIFFIDRYIVSSLNKSSSLIEQVGMALPRLALASVLAVIISTPLEIWVFRYKIDELLDSGKKKLTKDDTEYSVSHRDHLERKIEEKETELLQFNDRPNPQHDAIDRATNDAAHFDNLAHETLDSATSVGYEAQANRYLRNASTLEVKGLKEKEKDKARLESELLHYRHSVDSLNTLIRVKEKDAVALGNRAYSQNIATQWLVLQRFLEKPEGKPFLPFGRAIMLLFLIIEIAPIMAKLIMSRGEYEVIADGLGKIHENAVKQYSETTTASHAKYFDTYAKENITLFATLISTLNPTRLAQADKYILKYSNGESDLTTLFAQIRQFVVSDLPGEVGAKYQSETITPKPQQTDAEDGTKKTGETVENKGKKEADENAEEKKGPKTKLGRFLHSERKQWGQELSKWKQNLRTNAVKWIFSLSGTLATSIYIAYVSEDSTHGSVTGIISFVFTQVVDSIFKKPPHA